MELHIINGFLGSGKTTAILGAAKYLVDNGKKVGIVTNDKGRFQVDAAFFQSNQIPTNQVSGGCFRCSYGEFEQRIMELRDSSAPDVIFAEAVGSCVDLVNTIFSPLKQNADLKAERISYSVFADIRLFQVWINQEELPFSENILYLFEKQFEEGELIVLNKVDLLGQEEQQEVLAAAQSRFPGKQILLQNSLDHPGIPPWLNAVTKIEQTKTIPGFEVDYWTYKDGEREMAWLDHRFTITSDSPEASRNALVDIVDSILNSIQEANCMVGHIKFFVDTQLLSWKFSFTTADFLQNPLPSSWHSTLHGMNSNEVTVMMNARVSIQAEHFQQIVYQAFDRAEEHLNVEMHPLSGVAFNPEMSMERPD